MPGVVLHGRVPGREEFGRKPCFEAVRAESAQADRRGGKQRAEDEKLLQDVFLVLFFVRCGRFLP
jgi:hypothetical protein